MLKTLFSSLLLMSCCLAASAFAQLGGGANTVSLVPADQIPPAPALTPEEALKSFTLAPGFKLEIAAAEPLVQEPVAITFGADGRLWVVEMRGYMPDVDGNGEDAPVGRVVVLSDRDGDGRYDDSRVFLDQLVLPRAIALVDDGVLIGAPPELAFWRDTDGDGKADQKVVVAADYGVQVDPKRPYLANPEAQPNSLLWAYDNWIYSANYTKKFRYVKGGWEMGAIELRGQWGLSQDDHGRFYHNQNADYLRVDVIFSDYLQRNPNYPRLAGANVHAAADQFTWPARVTPGINRGYLPENLREGRLKMFTAACGIWIYRGDLLPEFYGNAFAAEPAGNFVRRAVLTAEHATVRSRNAYVRKEFIASTDERFRPVNFATGPDGALYIVDLYRGILQHRIAVTSYLRKQIEDRHLADPQHLGRIYRVVPVDKPAPRATRIAALTTAQWVERLSHPNSWWRETAQRILVERRDPAVVPAIRQVATFSRQPLGRVHALWTLEGVGALDRATVVASLDDQDPIVRAMAIRLSERFLPDAGRAELVTRWLALTKDRVPEVQLQALLTLGIVRDAAVDRVLADTVRTHPGNTFLGDALYSGLAGRELALLEQLAADAAWAPGDAEASKILSGLARGIFTSRQLSAIERLFSLAAAQPPGASQRAAALLDGIVTAAGASRRLLQFAHAPPGWNELAQIPTFQMQLAKLEKVVVWPGKPGASALDAVTPLTSGQQIRFATGKTLYTAVCAPCHQTSGRGLDSLTPPLLDSEWVLGSPEHIVRIVLHGVRGELNVLNRTYTGDMPAFGILDDHQISAILTYVRREWGHTASPLEPEQVKAIRVATAARSDAWSGGELKRMFRHAGESFELERRTARLETEKLRVVIADNSAYGPTHEAGMNGLAELSLAREGEPNIFVPANAGLNLEHIFSGDRTSFGWSTVEPRRAAMQLILRSAARAELRQERTAHWPLRSRLTFEIADDAIDLKYGGTPLADAWSKHGYIGVFFASYLHAPADGSIHFIGRSRPGGGDPRPRWIKHLPPAHGTAANHRPAGSTWDPPLDDGFNISLVKGKSDLEYLYPFYFGFSGENVLMLMFERPRDGGEIRFAQSPSGGGTGNPAWDFVYFQRGYGIDREFSFRVRAVYRKFIDRDDLVRTYERWSGETVILPTSEASPIPP